MITTPRVDALIELEVVRELKAEIALLRKVVMAAETMRYSNTAKAVRAFDAAITDWERVRGFERL